MKVNKMKINGEFIKQIRSDSHLGLDEFSKLFGVTTATIVNWESNRSYPNALQIAYMIQLRKKLDEYIRKNDSSENIKKIISTLLITGGIVAILSWLFKDE